MLPKKAGAAIAPKKGKGKLKKPGAPTTPPGPPQAQPSPPPLKAGVTKKLKGMSG